jgi:hypothetical protein
MEGLQSLFWLFLVLQCETPRALYRVFTTGMLFIMCHLCVLAKVRSVFNILSWDVLCFVYVVLSYTHAPKIRDK